MKRTPITESFPGTGKITETRRERQTMTPPTLSEADLDAIAAKILEGIREDLHVPQKALHEMSEAERTAYANQTWLAAGIVPIRPTVTDAADWQAAAASTVLPKPRGYDPLRGETPPGGAQ